MWTICLQYKTRQFGVFRGHATIFESEPKKVESKAVRVAREEDKFLVILSELFSSAEKIHVGNLDTPKYVEQKAFVF